MVWIRECPMRSITERRSEPPASSQLAWAWRRSWTRTLKSIPEALTARVQTRVRKVFREMGVDDLTCADELIRQWLVRMSDPEAMAARLEKPLAELAEMMREAKDPRDQMAAAYISMLMAGGSDEQSARTRRPCWTAGIWTDAPRCGPDALLPRVRVHGRSDGG